MPSPHNRAPQRLSLSTAQLQRAVGWAGAALLIVSLVFGVYYYWDRYVRLGDQSPLEMDIAKLEQAIRDNPQDPARRVALAEYYLGKEMYAEAWAQTKQVLARFPDDVGALLVSGIAQARLQQRTEAVTTLQKLVALRQDQPMASSDMTLEAAYYFLGESQLALNKPTEALAALEAALLINPTDADALWQAGLAAHALGQFDRALEYYHRAVRLVPNFAEVYTAMIDTYTALGQSPHVAYARGMQAFALGDYRTAQTHLESAAHDLPNFAPAFVGLGLTYEQTGQLPEALAAIQQALLLDPNDFAATQAQGRLAAALQAQGGTP